MRRVRAFLMGGRTVIAGNGRASLGDATIKPTAKKRRPVALHALIRRTITRAEPLDEGRP